MLKRLLLPVLISTALGSPLLAAVPSCSQFAEQAGEAQNIPPKLMAAISLVETGRDGQPWPWTLNEGGKGMHFETKAAALRYLEDAVARGVRNIDVGCMQLNFHWHAAGFASLDDMLDPQKNTRYAALYLAELQKRLGSWEEATKHYHSADPARGNDYRDKVVAAAEGVAPETGAMPPAADPMPSAGFLTAGAAPLVAVSAAGPTMADILKAAAEAAALGISESDQRVTLRTEAELPPRLRRKWQQLESVRKALQAD